MEPVLSVVVAGGDSARVTSERIVALVLYDGCAFLDWARPLEVLNTATLVSGGHGYRCLLVSPHGDAVRTGGGVGVTVDAALTDLARSNVLVDTLLVAGGLASQGRSVGPRARCSGGDERAAFRPSVPPRDWDDAGGVPGRASRGGGQTAARVDRPHGHRGGG